MGLTSILDLDRDIINYVSDSDLQRVSQVNRYLRDLICCDKFWASRVSNHIDSRYIREKHPDVSWRDWYFFWSHHRIDPIGSTLNLNPIQAYIRLVTEQGIMRGSETFQTINLLLPKAFATRDDDLVEYFMILLRRLFKLSLKENSSCRLLNYANVIPKALACGYEEAGIELLGMMGQEAEEIYRRDFDQDEIDQEYLDLSEALGKLNRGDLYKDHLEPPACLYERSYTPDQAFFAGLVKGHHDQEARWMFMQDYEDSFDADTSLEDAFLKSIDLIKKEVPAFSPPSLPDVSESIVEGHYDLVASWGESIPEKDLTYNPDKIIQAGEYLDLYIYSIIQFDRVYPGATKIMLRRDDYHHYHHYHHQHQVNWLQRRLKCLESIDAIVDALMYLSN